MSDAPELIWIDPDLPTWSEIFFAGDTEYVRVDTVTDKADAWNAIAEKNAKITALRAALEEAQFHLGQADARLEFYGDYSHHDVRAGIAAALARLEQVLERKDV
jgi:hypothetical protein